EREKDIRSRLAPLLLEDDIRFDMAGPRTGFLTADQAASSREMVSGSVPRSCVASALPLGDHRSREHARNGVWRGVWRRSNHLRRKSGSQVLWPSWAGPTRVSPPW